MENAISVRNVFQMVNEVIELRISSSVDLSISENSTMDLLFDENSTFELNCESEHVLNYIKEHRLNLADTIALGLALMPHLSPESLIESFSKADGNRTVQVALGGVKAKNHSGIIPTGETLLFCMAGTSTSERLYYYDYFLNESQLFQHGVLEFEFLHNGEPKLSAKVLVSEDFLDYFLTGRFSSPKMSSNFPAQKIETKLSWENLVLKERTFSQINEIMSWLKNNDKVMHTWGMVNKLKPGYRVMFYGAPGTGKTLTASLLGKFTGKDVYRVDLSLIVSKYIGETEKNLAKLFDKASNKDWILFFDEADSIFGKRTSVKDAHDKYANQEVSYLLQRIESHPGLVIIATNLKNNIDAAFTRRFHSMVEFEQPGEEERLKLWLDYIPDALKLDKDVSIRDISKRYHLSGSNILNVVQYACLKTADLDSETLTLPVLMDGIKKEYIKEGRVFK
jgi:AAA+ superfamily predicted ATPase